MQDEGRDGFEACKVISALLYIAYEQALENLVDEMQGDDYSADWDDEPGTDEEMAELTKVINSPGFKVAFERCTRFRQHGETAENLLAGMLLTVRSEQAARAHRKKLVQFPGPAPTTPNGGRPDAA